MKNMIFTMFFLLLITSSCKINQKRNGLKEGRWIYYDTINNDVYKHIEKYKKNEEVKVWKTFKNKKIYKKEKYKNDICYVNNYNNDGTLESKGKTKTTTDTIQTHWFYFGEWKYYDKKGNLIETKNFGNGIQIK